MTDKEKLEKIKSLADKMSDTAFNITTDASLLKKAIDEYHQFIINEYHKEEQIIKKLQEEPVSEDLEKAANEWDAKASFTPFYMALDDKGNPNGVKQDYTTHAESFKAGAKWQKQKDSMPVSEDLEEAVDEYAPDFSNSIASKAAVDAVRDAFKAGAKWQKEQMIAKAIDGIARPDDNEIWCNLSTFNFKDGDKCKVILIKED